MQMVVARADIAGDVPRAKWTLAVSSVPTATQLETKTASCWADVGTAASLAAPWDLHDWRNPLARLTVGFSAAFAGAGAAIAISAGLTRAAGLRPRPSAFANVERRSE